MYRHEKVWELQPNYIVLFQREKVTGEGVEPPVSVRTGESSGRNIITKKEGAGVKEGEQERLFWILLQNNSGGRRD